MNTARDRAAIGAEVAREEGRGPAGQASAAAKDAVTGRGGGIAGENPYAEGYMGAPMRPPGAIPATTPYDSKYRPGFTGDRRGEYDGVGGGVGEGMGTGLSGDRRGEYDGVGGGIGQGMGTGLIGDRRSEYDGVDRGVGHGMDTEMATGVTGPVESTKFELDRLRNRTVVTGEGDAYAPTAHQLKDLPKEFETRVQVIERYPEMKTVEKTDFVKEVHQEEKLISVPKTRVVMDEVETVDIVPVVKKVPKTRVEIVHRVVEEEQTFTDMVDVVEQVEVPRKEVVPRVVTEEVEETVIVPVVREVPVTTTTEVPTGNYYEAPVGEFVNPGDLTGKRHGHHGLGLEYQNREVVQEPGIVQEPGQHHGLGLGHHANVAGQEHGLHRSGTSSSSDDEAYDGDSFVDATAPGSVGTAGGPVGTGVATGTGYGASTVDPTRKKKKRGLLAKLTGH